MSYFLVRPDVGRYQPWSAEIHLRFQVARDHAVTHTSSYLSMPLQATNWVPVICGWLRRAFSRPARLRRARSPVRTSPLASGLPLTCEALPFASAALPLTCRAALTTPGGASLTTFGFVTIVPRYLLPQVMPSHSFAALTALVVRRINGDVTLFVRLVNGFADRPMPACTGRPHAPRRGIGVRTRQRHLAAAPGSGTLPPHGQKKTSSCVRSNLR